MPKQEAESKVRMLASVWNVLDFLAFFPPLAEALLLHATDLPFRMGRIDLRWFKLLRRGALLPCPAGLHASVLEKPELL